MYTIQRGQGVQSTHEHTNRVFQCTLVHETGSKQARENHGTRGKVHMYKGVENYTIHTLKGTLDSLS